MYLFCCTTEPKDDDLYIKILNSHVPIDKMPLFDLSINYNKLQLIINHIHEFNVTIFTSPKSIRAYHQVLSKLSNLRNVISRNMFYVMGESSAIELRSILYKLIEDNRSIGINVDISADISTDINIEYPKYITGASGLIEEILSQIDFTNKRVLLLKGSYGNIMLESWLKDKQINYTAINVYNHVKVLISKVAFLKILNNELQGIIITSGLMVDYLFELALHYNMRNYLIVQNFLTIHSKIADKLVALGVARDHIKITNTTNKNDLLALLCAIKKELQHD